VAVAGWILDKSAAARAGTSAIDAQLEELVGSLAVCPVGELEQLYSRPPDRALRLQHDLAHHHGMWHRTPIADLLIAETALYHGLGVVHVDGDFDRIAEVRPLAVRRLKE